MKSRFTTIDVCATITELREKLKGMRVTTVYDIDSKTYLIKLGKTECKVMLLVQSGDRIHTTEFEWPKNTMPSGFSMKCRKHLRSRRLVNISQLGVDRIVDLQFGSDEAAYHLIVELYDRGNIVLTDYEYTILSLLRTRTDTEDVKFAVRECYPIDSARQRESLMTFDRLLEIVTANKEGTELKKVLNPHVVYGTALLEHCLIEQGFPANVKIGSSFSLAKDLPKVMEALKRADSFMDLTLTGMQKGVIVQKREQKPSAGAVGDSEAQHELLTYQEFHPFLFNQHKKAAYLEFPSFDKAVDEFFSKVESQKLDMKALSQEKSAMKKLENVRRDHHRRIELLQMSQDQDMYKAELVELNLPLVDQAILIVNSAIANQIDWSEINSIVKEAQSQDDPVACAIGGLKLEKNHITMHLRNPYDESDTDSDEDGEEDETKTRKKKKKKGPNFTKVDINLALSAYANARSYYNQKKFSSKKEQKTIDASEKALKSAERKTKETLKEVATTAKIKKARKTYWFEKFFWFISSENYLVIGGRDQQQNELVVKRHLEQGDLYVHADLHGASSVIIKNPFGQPVPPKTLNEAGCMAVSYSAAWEARIVTSAWWVHHHQVSKTAPSGEYLTTGSFMIRGKKNFLPPCYLMMGFAFLFKLEEACIEKHLNERRVKALEDVDSIANEEGEEELFIPGDDSDGDEQNGEDRYTAPDADIDNDNDEAEGGEGASDSLYPDTNIELQLTKEGKLQLQRSTSRTDGQQNSNDMETNQQSGSKQRLSAKQRRENRKKARQSESVHSEEITEEDQDETQENVQPNNVETSNKITPQTSQDQQQKQQQAPKRGKKGKLKKIKEKYGEQDEYERQMKMEILASSGPAKESKADKRKKDKKGSKGRKQDGRPGMPVSGKQKDNPVTSNSNDLHTDETKEFSAAKKSTGTAESTERKEISGDNYNRDSRENLENGSDTRNTRNEIGNTEMVNANVGSTNGDRTSPTDSVVEQETDKLSTVLDDTGGEGPSRDEGDKNGAASDDDAEDFAIKENMSLLDSLTGCPLSDDDLLFAVPVCAPYTAVQNYKYKVKLTPGTSRRGKAAKTALNAFLFSKEATQREKDLLKSLKDNDLSRHIPGKVKISAPNLQKVKRK